MEPSATTSRKPWIDRVSAGFALAALVLVTVAVVAPEVEAVAGRTARTSALADVNAIGVALRAATNDGGDEVFGPSGQPAHWLFGPGVLPRDNALAAHLGFPLSGVLLSNGARAPRWRGPYLERVPIDPWGRAYVVRLDAGHGRQPMLILSAGPDGVLNTALKDGTVNGDDVGIVLMP
jgi:hypothetical protein